MMSTIGRIHSLDTFGTVDGPGIRFVLFMQGCALQCQYCHNRDTWDRDKGNAKKVEEILSEVEPYIHYYKSSKGGITITGGEPTLQAPFVKEVFEACKQKWNLHTALDTSGFNDPSRIKDLFDVTDLLLLDIKQMDDDKHKKLTGQSNERILKVIQYASEMNKKMWIRHVLIPGITDDYSDLFELGKFIGKLKNVEKVEILPYHRMGVFKWQQLGYSYPLEGVRTPTDQELKRAIQIVDKGIEENTLSKIT
ncbi:pyruvate formate-lyase-activating protein [Chengkuizengella axinellae]|uniref:Pyruvate formate-lyase-activating enzyme n=1 Tax=Chengkuizengella axinellae TaxID=3064388 RepID=A0ABT9ITJ8_9BACL|nr:pyruvate formate-lyase-activating protein [Chengkuizengella sp. 2205SS18-9]MDP5272638.1 pyruvate formate-lyase-activating protein [Chengkuizengella sp. 2205SS18-9]